MAETVSTNKIYETLVALKKEVDFIKEHMVDVDTILTPEEEKMLDESLEEHKQGKTISLKDLKKELGD